MVEPGGEFEQVEYVERHGPLTLEQAVSKALAIVAAQSNVRDEAKWADAFFDIAIVLGRVPEADPSGRNEPS